MTVKINPEKYLAWAKELKTTTKTQTNGVLRDETGYCCLGILYEMEGEHFKQDKYGEFLTIEDELCASLPSSFRDGMGENVTRTLSDENFFPVYFNDSMELTFPQIAEKIEEYVKRKIEAGEIVS